MGARMEGRDEGWEFSGGSDSRGGIENAADGICCCVAKKARVEELGDDAAAVEIAPIYCDEGMVGKAVETDSSLGVLTPRAGDREKGGRDTLFKSIPPSKTLASRAEKTALLSASICTLSLGALEEAARISTLGGRAPAFI